MPRVPEAVAECAAVTLPRQGERLAGDVVIVRRIAEEGRLLCLVCDGLGHGVKANVLAELAAHMAVTYAAAGRDAASSAAAIRRTLPICRDRGLAYATLSIAEVAPDGVVNLSEYGNPAAIRARDEAAQALVPDRIEPGDGPGRDLRLTTLRLGLGDRLVLTTDGVTQAGMGLAAGAWNDSGLTGFCAEALRDDPCASALAGAVVEAARQRDGGQAQDDISCAVVAWRRPRRLLVVTGAPYDDARDGELARAALDFDGRRAICGGTTADIVARELGLRIANEAGPRDPEIPPAAILAGFDLVTEGMITLARTLELLEARAASPARPNAASRLAALLLDSDLITFQVGTRLNAAHQDPSLPRELGIRRTVVRRIAQCLRERHAKTVDLALV